MDQELSPPESDTERTYEIVPAAPRGFGPGFGPARIIGPGRRERAYLEKLARLETELEAAALVERGSARRLDRMERKLEAVREAATALEQKEHRLILALGAVQRENEMLRERLVLSLAPRQAEPTPVPKVSWLGRILRRS